MKSAGTAAFIIAASALAFGQSGPERTERGISTAVFSTAQMSPSFLGVEMEEVTKDNYTRFGLGEVRGVAIDRVMENSPAANAGIQKGDIILRFDGETVSSSRKLQRLVSEVAPDHKASVTVLRGGVETEIQVTIGRRESPAMLGMSQSDGDDGPRSFEFRVPRIEGLQIPERGSERRIVLRGGERRAIGVGVTALTKQLGDHFGVSGGKGLLVNEVRENSPAAKAGLRAGDIITEADGKAVAENNDLIQAVNAKKEGEVELTVLRNKKRLSLKVTPEVSREQTVERQVETFLFEGPARQGGAMRRQAPRGSTVVGAPIL